MEMHVLGRTGPVGRAIVVRLAMAGYGAVLGSRNSCQAVEACDDDQGVHGAAVIDQRLLSHHGGSRSKRHRAHLSWF